MLRIAHNAGCGDQCHKRRLAVDQRSVAKIAAVEIEKIEGIIHIAPMATGRECILQRRKARDTAGTLDDDLAIDDGCCDRQAQQRGG